MMRGHHHEESSVPALRHVGSLSPKAGGPWVPVPVNEASGEERTATRRMRDPEERAVLLGLLFVAQLWAKIATFQALAMLNG